MRALVLAAFLAIPWSGAGAQMRVQEYPLPPRITAHDVWADPAPDGPVWFSGQGSGNGGRLDPKTGKVELIALGPGASPHGVILDRDGSAWFTDSGQNAIVRVDPKTLAVKDGTVYFASLAGSYVGRIDAATHKVQVIEPPTPGQGARRVWSDSKGLVWVAEWNSGNLSRYDPRSGAWKTWKAPGERPRVYAVYVDETDKVWIAEWDKQLMMRFDPATEKFESFASASGTANVRQIHGRKGEVWTPESASGKLVVYRYR